MSHFTCLVIGPDIEAQLQPFHEYECTGDDDQYVQEIDCTEEARAEYESKTKPMVRNEATGEVAYAYDDRFYREPTPDETRKHGGPFLGYGVGGGLHWKSKDWDDGRGYRGKIHEIPEGWTEIEVLYNECMTFAEFIGEWYSADVLRPGDERTDEHKYAFVELDQTGEVVRYVKRTNPNKHWDGWTIGGRWTGFFPLKEGAQGKLGRRSIFGGTAEAGTADQCRKGDIDFERARSEAAAEADKEFSAWERCFAKAPRPEPWSSFAARIDDNYSLEQARTDYNKQVAICRWKNTDHGWGCPVQTYGFDREAYVRRCRNSALVPHAIVKDGKWHESGEMGWWGVVHNEKDPDEWDAEVQRLYDDLPDDTLLTLVDCHI